MTALKQFNRNLFRCGSFYFQSRPAKVVIGMSGGVDSTVAAILLKNKGFELSGVFMKNWDERDEEGNGICRADKEAEDAEMVCNRLEIPFSTVNFVKEYWNEVFEELLTDYESGSTPNPDIECNRRIKFGHFFNHCREHLGCDAVATGHYARTTYGDFLQAKMRSSCCRLLQAMDRVKDQTFFLAQVPQEALANTMFPLGSYNKEVVKKIATYSGFENIAKKKESMGICFVGKRRRGFQTFIGEYVDPNPGVFKDVDTGKVVGNHDGIHQWTVGQRIPLSGQKQKAYVVSKDLDSQTIQICFGQHHPALYSQHFYTDTPHWIDNPPNDILNNKSYRCQYRSQHTEPLSDVTISYGMSSSSSSTNGVSWAPNHEFVDKGSLVVSLAKPERAVTCGQYAVFYYGDECLGSAKIRRVGPSLYTMNTDNCRDIIQKDLEDV